MWFLLFLMCYSFCKLSGINTSKPLSNNPRPLFQLESHMLEPNQAITPFLIFPASTSYASPLMALSYELLRRTLSTRRHQWRVPRGGKSYFSKSKSWSWESNHGIFNILNIDFNIITKKQPEWPEWNICVNTILFVSYAKWVTLLFERFQSFRSAWPHREGMLNWRPATAQSKVGCYVLGWSSDGNSQVLQHLYKYEYIYIYISVCVCVSMSFLGLRKLDFASRVMQTFTQHDQTIKLDRSKYYGTTSLRSWKWTGVGIQCRIERNLNVSFLWV